MSTVLFLWILGTMHWRGVHPKLLLLLKSKKIYSLLVAVAVDDGKVERGAETKQVAWMAALHVLENLGSVK
jgi:hypothetical protein